MESEKEPRLEALPLTNRIVPVAEHLVEVGYQPDGDGWYMPPGSQKPVTEVLSERVDVCRRTVSFFFQRYEGTEHLELERARNGVSASTILNVRITESGRVFFKDELDDLDVEKSSERDQKNNKGYPYRLLSEDELRDALIDVEAEFGILTGAKASEIIDKATRKEVEGRLEHAVNMLNAVMPPESVKEKYLPVAIGEIPADIDWAERLKNESVELVHEIERVAYTYDLHFDEKQLESLKMAVGKKKIGITDLGKKFNTISRIHNDLNEQVAEKENTRLEMLAA